MTDALLTAEEFARLPESDGPLELVQGRILRTNFPGMRHGYVCSNIAMVLANYLRDCRVGEVVCNNVGVVTQRNPDSVRGPDVSFYSFQRIPTDEFAWGYPSQAPELAFEVECPTDIRNDTAERTLEYLAGVVNVVVVDPELEIATIYDASGRQVKLKGNATFALPELLPNFEVPIARFFRAQ